jgi:Flp pilus assembly pilin Flp
MRTVEYVVLTIFLCGLIVWGATAVANSISASFANSAAMIATSASR